MPCYTIKKTQVNVAKMDLDILVDALKAAGFAAKLDQKTIVFSKSGSYLYHNYHNGVLSITGGDVEAITAAVKQAYSAGVVRKAASQFGWKLSSKDNQTFVAQKRR